MSHLRHQASLKGQPILLLVFFRLLGNEDDGGDDSVLQFNFSLKQRQNLNDF